MDVTQAVALGTTIMAASYKGGVVLGADSRTSTGSYIANRVTNKLTQLAEKVYVCRSGSAADTQNISAYVEHALQQHAVEGDGAVAVAVAANLAQQILYNNKNNLSAGMIVAGWDNVEGGAVYALPLGGSMVRVPFSIGGSGSAYIYGFCDKNWRPDFTEEECKAFVVRAVSLAIGRDGSSGGCVRTVTIDEAGVRRDFLPGTKLELYGEKAPLAQAVTASA